MPEFLNQAKYSLQSIERLQHFLDDLRAFESGIDPEKYDWYVANWNSPTIKYICTKYPGRVVRAWETGEFETKLMTIEEYFRCLGVENYFDEKDPTCLTRMQYRSMNPLGFVGYQIGESALMETGYYEPLRRRIAAHGSEITCNCYYVAPLPASEWRFGKTEKLLELPDGRNVIATDTNTWNGSFTSKNEIESINSLIEPRKQEIVIRDIMEMNLRHIQNRLHEQRLSLATILSQKWNCPDISPQPITCTLSGVVAAAHLVGKEGVFELLVGSGQAADENGTDALEYMHRFASY